MAKQGERYNPKTKTGWKFENGRTVYYKKGKILNNRQQLLSLGKDIVAPLVSGAQTIRDKLRIAPLSETGESVFEYNKRIDKAQDEYDDSAEVAEFQKYQKKANIYNKAEGLRVQKAKDFEEEAQMYADETGRSVEFAKRMLRGEHAENTVIKGNVPPNEGGESEASGNNSNFKSDVFTIDPETGKAVGVLTRSQRRAFDKKNQAALEKAAKDKLKIRTYRNKGNTYQRYG